MLPFSLHIKFANHEGGYELRMVIPFVLKWGNGRYQLECVETKAKAEFDSHELLLRDTLEQSSVLLDAPGKSFVTYFLKGAK